MPENVFKLNGNKFIISEGYGSVKTIDKVIEARKIDKMYQSGQLSQSEYDRFKDYEKKQATSTSAAPTQPQSGSTQPVKQDVTQANTQQDVSKPTTEITAPEGTIAKIIINAGFKDPTNILNQIKQWGNSNGITFNDDKLGKLSDTQVNEPNNTGAEINPSAG